MIFLLKVKIMFKIGNIYIRSDELNDEINNILSKHFQLIPLNSDLIPSNLQNYEEYEKQFQPFYYSDDFDVYKDYDEGATPGACLLIIHTSIYDEIKRILGMDVKTVNVRNENDKIAKPYDDGSEDADIDFNEASHYILTFNDNNFTSQDDYIHNPKSLPKTVVDYLDLECKNVCYNWDGNNFDYFLNRQFKSSVYGFINNYNFNTDIKYIKSLEDFWNSIGNIDNFDISEDDISLDFESECEEIRDRLYELREDPESIENLKDIIKVIKNEDLEENDEFKDKLLYKIRKIENSYKLLNLFIKYSNSDFNELDNITLLLILIYELDIDISKYYFDYDQRLKQIEIRNENMPHSRYKEYYCDYREPIKSTNYPEYEIKHEKYSKFIENYIDKKDYINSALHEKELFDGDSYDETETFDTWGALIFKYGNRYMYNEYVNWFIYRDPYIKSENVKKLGGGADLGLKVLKENTEKYYWYSFVNNIKIYNRIDESKINVEYIYCPNAKFNEKWRKPKIFFYSGDSEEIYYSPNGEYIENENYTLNKYLPDIIIKSSNLFTEFRKEYSKTEVYNLDVRKYLKTLNRSKLEFINKNLEENENEMNENKICLPRNSKELALTIHHLISYVSCDLVDEYSKALIHNLFYLQMTDILDLIELITRKHLFNVYLMNK